MPRCYDIIRFELIAVSFVIHAQKKNLWKCMTEFSPFLGLHCQCDLLHVFSLYYALEGP